MNPEKSNSNTQTLAAPTPPVPVPNDFADAKLRKTLRDELRAEEWAMHQDLLAAARMILKTLFENPHKHTMADVARILDLSSRLGRLATESENGFGSNVPDSALVMIEFKDALTRVYARRQVKGRPVPDGAVADVEPVIPKE